MSRVPGGHVLLGHAMGYVILRSLLQLGPQILSEGMSSSTQVVIAICASSAPPMATPARRSSPAFAYDGVLIFCDRSATVAGPWSLSAVQSRGQRRPAQETREPRGDITVAHLYTLGFRARSRYDSAPKPAQGPPSPGWGIYVGTATRADSLPLHPRLRTLLWTRRSSLFSNHVFPTGVARLTGRLYIPAGQKTPHPILHSAQPVPRPVQSRHAGGCRGCTCTRPVDNSDCFPWVP